MRQQILSECLANVLLIYICQSATDFHNIYKNINTMIYPLRFSILSTFLTSSSKYSISSSSIFFFACLNYSSLTSLSSLTSFATSPISFTSPYASSTERNISPKVPKFQNCFTHRWSSFIKKRSSPKSNLLTHFSIRAFKAG